MDAHLYYMNVLQPLLAPDRLDAPQWEARGKTFDADIHIIVGSDHDSQESARLLLEKYGALAIASYVQSGPWVSIELMLSRDANGAHQFYASIPTKVPKPIGVFRSAEERVPPGFSGYLAIPATAKSWAETTPVARYTPLAVAELQSFVGGHFEFSECKFGAEKAGFYCNETGLIRRLKFNTLATAFTSSHLSHFTNGVVGDVVMTFGYCRERGNGNVLMVLPQ